MYASFVAMLQGLKPPYMLLIQACIVILIPYILWRTINLGKWFPLGVIQIFAGVLLGPSIFGLIAPDLFQALFGTYTYAGKTVVRADQIGALATIAVCLFGFLAGADADKELIRKSGRTVFNIGVFGMLFGWGIAILAGLAIYATLPAALGAKANIVSFSVAYGLVIAVSALPVLAVILRSLDVTRRRLGAVALASAGLADTMMWMGLGLVVALALGGNLTIALAKILAGGVLSIGFILWVASPILNRMMRNDAPESAVMTLTVLSIFVASAITAITELHPVLGAFVAGVFLPDKVREMAAHRLDQPTTLVLMPFFFLFTGLRTSFSFGDPNVWILFSVSTFLCVFGKMIGHGFAARMSGENWPFSAAVGLLLQTKGLMGLIVISVFLEKEVVSTLMFSAAVLMCMFSTGLSAVAVRGLKSVYSEAQVYDGLKEGQTAPAEAQAVPAVAEPSGTPIVTVASPAPSKPALATLVFDGIFGRAELTEPRTVVGRHSNADVRVNDVRVSRHHALIVRVENGKFEIHNQMADRSEPNPILVNGQIKEHATLADGDKVSLGGVSFVFRIGKVPG